MEGEVQFPVDGVDKPCTTWYKVFGDLKTAQRRPLVVLHGGPGVVHNYLLSLADLVGTHSIPVVLYDQLGNGKSTHLPEKNGDTAFWTDDLFIKQLEHLVLHLGIQDSFDLLGHSWGGMLGARFATRRPHGLKRLVLTNSPASMHLWVEAANRLRSQLPKDVQETLDKHEADGTTDSKEYHDAVGVFYARHLCRLDPMPEEVTSALGAIETDPTVYLTMNGPSEFFITGSLKDWSIVDDIHKITVPTLLLNGRYDEAQDSIVVPFFRALSKVKWYTFSESSHMPQYEERERFMQIVGDFLTADL
ncbi:proline-specific peptidase [Polyporus arcularius HHB13444]|uniref:Proline-specific peptidase n=1 Tax=Polyporus arcularius HHB13444 TaxID=1314778 RepID=A0A5C3PXY9_9APHY|nr:proline-specific peptidase [Polyporus arcularius HHB13444]